LFESIPSDDESYTSVDDTDEDIDYTLKIQNANFVIEESSDSSDCEVGSYVDILNLDNTITFYVHTAKSCQNVFKYSKNSK